jgi:hypothetical protein
MMTDEFRLRRVRTVREIASNADPFTKKRLLDLAARYEQAIRRSPAPIPLAGIGLLEQAERN